MGHLLGLLHLTPSLHAYAAAVQADEQLCASLLRLLSPAVSAQAVGLQLPPERRLPAHSWDAAARYASFTAAALLQHPDSTAVREAVAGGGSGAGAGGSGVARFVQAAAQLMQHVPPGGDAAACGGAVEERGGPAALLAIQLRAACQLLGGCQGSGVSAAAKQRLCPLLLGALPAVAAALRAAVERPPGKAPLTAAAHLCHALAELILALVMHLADDGDACLADLLAAAGVERWCDACITALQVRARCLGCAGAGAAAAPLQAGWQRRVRRACLTCRARLGPAAQALPLAVRAVPPEAVAADAGGPPAAGASLAVQQLVDAAALLGQRCAMLVDFACLLATAAPKWPALLPAYRERAALAACADALLAVQTAGCRAVWYGHGAAARPLALHSGGWRAGVCLALRPVHAVSQLLRAANAIESPPAHRSQEVADMQE